MNFIPAHKKELIDCTEEDRDDRLGELEQEVERLNAIVTQLLTGGFHVSR